MKIMLPFFQLEFTSNSYNFYYSIVESKENKDRQV